MRQPDKFKVANELKNAYEKRTLTFTEAFYASKDSKTIMGEVPFREILFLEYRDTEAGSNPREYTGLKSVNKEIIKSLLKDSINMFRFLHSGVIVCMTNPTILKDNMVKYDDCCLTNGNQTRFIILMVTLLKLLYPSEVLCSFPNKF